MSLLSRIIFTIITASVFMFLLFTTYIASNFLTYSKPHYEKIELGLFELNKNNDLFTLNEVQQTNTGGVFVEKINFADKIIFSKGNINLKNELGNSIIEVTGGIYLFDLREINTNYIIRGSGFEINNKGPGLFFINNINPRNNIIFSLNSVVNLLLKDHINKEDITSIDIYPHTYLIFNPTKNASVKNADLLKISQNFNLGFFNKEIINNTFVSDDFIKLISLKNEKHISTINKSILYIKYEYLTKGNLIKNFIDSTLGTLPGESFINKYSILFINKNKKSLYYKNIILRNLHDILSKKNIDIKTINLIIENIELLKKIDDNGSKEIEDIIMYYYVGVINSNKNINTKINFVKLKDSINNINDEISLKSLINLETLFFKYDFLENNNYYYNEISNFKKEYLKSISKDNKLNISKIEKIDYFLFFIENILISNHSESNINIKDLILIFNDYVTIANKFYEFSNDTTQKTGIFTNFKILNKFIKIIQNEYFLKERNENILLQLNKQNIIKKNDLSMLKNNINEIFDFYKKHKSVLKPKDRNKDKNLIKLYSNLENKYIEYFDALDSYKEYIIKYDKTKEILLTTDTVNEKKEKTILSTKNALNYIKQFNGLNLKKININIMDYNYCSYPDESDANAVVENPYCYKIENISIDNKNISFLLHPFLKNKINEINIEYINEDGKLQNDVKSGSYKLDEIKTVLDEKMKNESKDKDRYNFQNFLVNTFGNNIQRNTSNNIKNTTITETTKIVEDPVVKVFKRNKLLGEYGEFSNIKFININYSDLLVEKKGEKYIINLKDILFNIHFSEKTSFYGEFSSNYNFADKHSFINPKLILIDKKTGKDLLLGNYIYINGEYKVNFIDNEIKKIFYYYDQIESIINYTNQTKIKITYIKDLNQVLFEVPNGKNNIYITLDNGNITKIKHRGENKLESIIPYTELPNILNNIKK